MADADSTTPASKPPRLRVRPHTRRVVVSVDYSTIDIAVRKDSRHCWIAEAIAKAAPWLEGIDVDLHTIHATEKDRRLHLGYVTPRVVARAIIDFDEGDRPPPFTFTLASPKTITRSRGQDKSGLSVDERRQRDLERWKNNRSINRQISAQSLDEPFKPPREYVAKVVAAMEDPSAPLGPAVLVSAPHAGDTHHPVQLGGQPPRRPSVFRRTRRFGMRDLAKRYEKLQNSQG